MNKEKDFIKFLSSIDLEAYRKRFVGNKSVEEDLPKNIQILKYIYKQYWVDRNYLSFDEFINIVISEIESDLRLYNKKRNNFSKHSEGAYLAFLDGWVARQYRTWASILTQIQFGYCCEEFFIDKKVLMCEELDIKGIDVRIENYKDFGVKKISNRKDMTKLKRLEKIGVTPITYSVPTNNILKDPFKKNGEYRKPYLDFKNDKRLDILDNGFIIFTKKIFDEITE